MYIFKGQHIAVGMKTLTTLQQSAVVRGVAGPLKAS